MKYLLYGIFILSISSTFISCTRVPISENTELSTGGEEDSEVVDPDADD